MKLVVRVQYIGERARLLLREDQAAEYTKGLIDDLEYLGFPMPQEQKPIEKSGFMLCVWHVERDSDLHRTIQNAFIKAKAEAASLVDRSIRYISLNEDGIMHTTSLGNKPYKPKNYNKQMDFQSTITNQQAFGKAPKYPTVISQARKAVTPLSQRIGPGLGHNIGHYNEYGSRDVEMTPLGEQTSPGSGSDASANVMDVTQQTLMQLSQSSAFQSLLQRGPSVPIKMETSSTETSAMLRPPASPPAQPAIPNLQALLQKAGVKSASAQAFLSAQSNLSSSTPLGSGTSVSQVSGTNATPVPSSSSLFPSTSGSPLSLSIGASGSTLTPPTYSSSNIPNLPVSRPSSTTPASTSRNPAANAATRELWDVRRQITALQARETSLVSELQRLGHPVPPMEGASTTGSEHRVKTLESQVTALREDLAREQHSRRVAEALLRAERAHLAEVENTMKDATRECKQPFVVPALLDAFIKIGQMTGDALKDVHGGTGGTVSMEL